MPVYTTTPIAVLHCPDLVAAARSVSTGGLCAQDAVAAMLGPLAAPDSAGPHPADLVVVTGNVAGAARPDEYEIAYSLLTALRDALHLDPDRIVAVPGSGDVNRLKCQAHFLEREASGESPTPPYWDKWQPFATMLRRFHGIELPKDQPWSIAEYPGLHVVVAGLNSTMAQSHREQDRYGYLGAEQLRWFADRLRAPTYSDWLRIGVIHHQPGGDDAGRLRDTDQFAELLGPHLDVVLHGQVCDARIRLLDPSGVPVLASGQPGRWQAIDVETEHLRLREDPRGGTGAGPVALPDPPPRRPARRRGAPAGRSRLDRLTADVAEIYRLRFPGADVTPVRWQGTVGAAYLRISPNHAAGAVHRTPTGQHPIGIQDGTPTGEDIERFIDQIVVRFRTGSVTPDALLVHTGAAVDQLARERARGRGVDVVPFTDFQLGHDLDGFARRQAEMLHHDPVYPAGLYVAQRYTEFGGGLPPDTDAVTGADLLAWLRNWIDQPSGRLVVVLGTFGHGKTFLLRQLARRMQHDGCQTLPVLIDLRGFEKAYSLDELVAVQLSRSGLRQIDLDTFRYLRRAGRVALFFDGFDELAARVSYDRATNHLDTIVQAAEGRAKVIITSRDQHFLTDADVLSALGAQPGACRRVVRLADFDDQQILTFLTNRLGGPAAGARLDMLRDVKDLLGLSRNPRMLSFITDLEEDRLRTAMSPDGTVTAASLYREILDRWLAYEARRLDRLGPLAPGMADLLYAVTHLALRLWVSPDSGLSLDDLGTAATTISQLTSTAISEAAGLDPQEAAHLVGSSTLLVRSGERRFAFVHHSVREWLVAHHVAGHLTDRVTGRDQSSVAGHLLGYAMSPLLIDFLCGLAGPELMRAWAERTLGSDTAPPGIGRNAAEILRHLRVTASAPPHMAGFDLRGKDFSNQPLTGADLARANLAGARLIDTDLTDTDLTSANLAGARLDRAALRGADLTDADLTGARLLGADLTDADLTRVRLRRAALVGATGVPRATLATADTLGAALSDAARPRPQFASCTMVHAVAVDSRTRLVAGGGADGAVRIWDTGTGVPLRTLPGHTAAVHAIGYAPDGLHLASASDDQTIRIWDTTTGTTVHTLTGHTARIRSIAYSPDGWRLASAGHDRTIRIWDTTTGTAVHTLTGHTGWVRSIMYSPDGRHLASAGNDETIRIWDTTTGTTVHTLTGHTGTVHAVAYAPSHRLIASAGDDRSIRVWDTETGQTVRVLTGHTDPTGHTGWIRSVSYAPDGRHLASASDDNSIRIWDTETGQTVRTLTGHTGRVHSVSYYHDSYHLASAGDDNTIRIWDTADGRQLRTIGGDGGESRSVCFSPDDRWLASGANDGTVQLWSATSDAQPRTLTGHGDAVTTVTFSPDSTRLAGAGYDGKIRIWNPIDGQPLDVLAGHTAVIDSIAFAPDGQYLASADEDATIRIWNTVTGDQLRVLTGHTDRVTAVAFSPDSTRLASAGHDGTIRLWSTTANHPPRTLTGCASAIHAIAFSADGRYLASAEEEATVRIWMSSGGPPHLLTGHTGPVTAVAFSPDSTRLASAGHDGTIRVWEPATGRLLSSLAAGMGWIRSIAYAPDGRCLASAGNDRAVRLWDLPRSELRTTLVPLASGGSAVLAEDLGYTLGGVPHGEFWYVIDMCRFEPGELDAYIPALRPVPAGARLW